MWSVHLALESLPLWLDLWNTWEGLNLLITELSKDEMATIVSVNFPIGILA